MEFKSEPRRVSNIAALLLVGVSTIPTAKITWDLISPAELAPSKHTYSRSSTSPVMTTSSVPATITAYNLFGKLESIPSRLTAEMLTKPKDNVSLIGVVSKPKGGGYAFINYNGKIGVIAPGNTLGSIGNENLALRVVRSDGVELERLDTDETLDLLAPSTDLQGVSRKVKVAASLEQETPIPNATIAPNSQARENKLLPAKNSDFSGTVFNLKPFQTKDERRVFIITSGNDRERLQQLNIHPGDIVTHINQESVDRYSLTEALELIKQNKPITLKLKRGVETLEFTLETTS